MKKILVISYYWPPNSGSGVQRWLKFSKFLPLFNWQPIIITPSNPYSELSDSKLEKNISNNIQVVKYPIWEPYSLKDKIFGKRDQSQNSGLISNDDSLKNNIFKWVRGNLFIPDPKKYWIEPTVKSLLKKIKEENIEYIVSTGPPHSMHLIALEIKKKINNIKWIADFRDPWSKLDLLDDFNLSKNSRSKHERLELEVLSNADVTLTVSESWAKDFLQLGAKNVKLITNGYDSEDFNDFKSKENNKFIIGHYGILNHLRNPSNLWFTLNKICSENSDFNSLLEIHLSGNIDKIIIDEINSFAFLKNKLKLLGYLEHEDVIDAYASSSLLLLLLFNSESGKGNYPGKLFEYLATRKPILAFGPASSDVKVLLDQGYGVYHDFNISNNILENSILGFFNKTINLKTVEDQKYSRKHLTSDLVNLLNDL